MIDVWEQRKEREINRAAVDQALPSVRSHLTLTVLWGAGIVAPETPGDGNLPRSQS